jgi:hypothetical protein
VEDILQDCRGNRIRFWGLPEDDVGVDQELGGRSRRGQSGG